MCLFANQENVADRGIIGIYIVKDDTIMSLTTTRKETGDSLLAVMGINHKYIVVEQII